MSNRVLVFLLCGAILLNALWFTSATAIPLPSADAWYFIDTFVRKALGHELQFADFFAQRFAGDHSQPLQRLVLLGHLRLTDLDFRVEALVGISVGVLTCCLLARELMVATHGPAQRRPARWGIAAIFAVGLSLNSTVLYTWSLVSLAWISLLAAVLYWRVSAASLPGRSYAVVMLCSTFALGMVTDEVAFPVFAAAVAAVLLRDGVRQPRYALLLLLAGGIGLFGARWLIGSMGDASAAATNGTLSQLVNTLSSPDAWKLVVGPLADSVIHQQHLAAWFPGSAIGAQILIAAFLAILHAVFWWQVLSPERRPDGRVLVLGVACMLFFYASIAGIALSRVGEHGIEYVHQPRYVVIFAMNVIALLLVFSAPPARKGGNPAAVLQRRLGIAVGAAVLLLQIPLTYAAWKQAPYIGEYSRRAAIALARVAQAPASDTTAAACPPILRICFAPTQVRVRTIALMREHGLNIFSARFRAAYGLEELDPIAQPALARSGAGNACDVRILKRGPMQITKDGPFHRRANGVSAFWLTVPPETGAFAIAFEGKPLKIARRTGVATFAFDDRQADAVAAGRPLHFELMCSGRKVGSFDVLVVGSNRQGR
jgi:hypothetical protein